MIDFMPEQLEIEDKGGTMRLGKYDCKLTGNTKAMAAYGREMIEERHRHRFEVNNRWREKLFDNGLMIAGINPERDLVEIIEIESHPWFVGVQFHPELKSTVNEPHPLFVSFVEAALSRSLGKPVPTGESKEAVS